MYPPTKDRLLAILEPFQPEPYDVPGAKGQRCICVWSDFIDPFEFLAEILLRCEPQEIPGIAINVRSVDQDESKMGKILYWPSVLVE